MNNSYNCQTVNNKIENLYMPIIVKLYEYLGKNEKIYEPHALGCVLIYIRKILKEFEMDFNEKTTKVILELPSEHKICIFGILGCCMFEQCMICLKIKTEFPLFWEDWISIPKLKHVPSSFIKKSSVSFVNQNNEISSSKQKKSKKKIKCQNFLDFRDDTKISGFINKPYYNNNIYNTVKLFNGFSNSYDIYNINTMSDL